MVEASVRHTVLVRVRIPSSAPSWGGLLTGKMPDSKAGEYGFKPRPLHTVSMDIRL